MLQTTDEYVKMLNAKRTVSDFFSDINRYGYNTEYSDLSYGRAKKNYERLLKRLAELNLPDPKKFKFSYMSKKELKDTLESLLNKILGPAYQPIISELLRKIKTIQIDDYFDSIIEEEPQNDCMVPKNIYISNQLYTMEVVSTSHEFAHGFMSKYKGPRFNDHFTNIHYNELLPILIEYIVCYELSILLKDKTLIPRHEQIRAFHDQAQARELLDIRALSGQINRCNSLEKPFYQQYSTYQEHNAYTYITDDIFSIHLSSFYIEDQSTLLKLIKAVIDGEKTLQELINYYGISLRNEETLSLYNEQLDRALKYQR